MRIPKRLIVLLMLGFVHLSLTVIYSVRKEVLQKEHPVLRTLYWYGEVTGAISEFGFFAPGVGTQLRAQFSVTHDSPGSSHLYDFRDDMNRESQLRYGNMVSVFGTYLTNVDFRRSLAASYVSAIYSREPSAKEITILVDSFALPSMKEYREGRRGSWQKIYQASFRRKSEGVRHVYQN